MSGKITNIPYTILAGEDKIGRVLPHGIVKSPVKHRTVGLFYFLWCGEHSSDLRPLDITKLLAAMPDAGYHGDSGMWGAYSTMHHWGEPLYGYYYSTDEWVMRRHIELLTAAGVDFLVFDTTNAVTYTDKARMMLRLLSEYRAAGFDTPRAVFYTNTASGATALKIYNEIYARGEWADSWFILDGKPLIIAFPDDCDATVRDFFTVRRPQWPNEPAKAGGWPWMDFERPQRVFKNEAGEDEIINVSVAQHPQLRFGDSAMYGENGNRGRSYHNGAIDHRDSVEYGNNAAEQWERAIEADAPFVFVTGWNEWIAGRWKGSSERPLMFVDCADMEYSRDIEPMRGGFEDCYYFQLIDGIRRFKGADEAPAIERGDTARYVNFPCKSMERNADGYGCRYKNSSGRNEIHEMTVTDAGDGIVFTAVCAEEIDGYDRGGDFMTLFIDTGKKPSACGFDRVVNGYAFSDKHTSIAVCTGDSETIEADTFRIFAAAGYELRGDTVTLTVPKTALGLNAGAHEYELRFKWADSRIKLTRRSDFYEYGDAAPLGGLKYIFKSK